MKQSPGLDAAARGGPRDVTGRTAVALACAIFAAFALGSVWREPGQGGAIPVLFASAFLPLYWLAAWLALRASRNPALDPPGRRGWRLIAAANAILAVNNLLFASGVHVFRSLDVVEPAGLLLQGTWYGVMFLALASLPRGMDSRLERATFWLDAATVFTAGLLILVFVFHHTPGESSARTFLSALGTVAFPALNGVVIFAALIVWLRPGAGVSRSAIALIAVAAALIVVADLGYYRVTQEGQHAGGAWYDPLYLLASLLSVIASYRQGIEEPRTATQYDFVSSRSSVLPYLAVCSALLIVLVELGDRWGSAFGFLVLGCVVMTALVMCRQLIARRHIATLVEREHVGNRRFRSLVERGSDLILVADRSGVVRYRTGNTEGVLGRAVAALDGRALPTLAHPDDAARLAEVIAAGKTSTGRPLRWRSSSEGGDRELESVVRDFTDEPAVGGVVLNTRDVSEERALELQLQQAQKLEALGLLAGGIAHDFNNVLAAVRVSADLLADAPDEASRQEDLAEIVSATHRGVALTRQLLAFGRRDSVQVRNFDLRDVVTEMQGMLLRLLTRDVVLEADVPPSAVPVECDRGQIEQVLLNLVINARDAMPDGGVIRVSVGTAPRPSGEQERAFATLEVADTGIGMSASIRERVFEPFFTTKPRGKGTGLGLSTAFAIIDRAGGVIDVSSARGEGTTFEVWLPLAHPSPDAAVLETPESAPRSGNHERILVVDDEAAIRDAVGRFLRHKGYQVTVAASGAEALAAIAAAAEPFALLLTDLTMPGIAGRAFIDQVRTTQPDIRVICMTGYSERGLGDTPVAHLIEKPFNLDTLARLVRETLDTPA